MKLKAVQLLTLIICFFSGNHFEIKAAEVQSTQKKSLSQNYITQSNSSSNQEYLDNSVQDLSKEEKFVIVVMIASLGVFIGTGQSIKYLKNK